MLVLLSRAREAEQPDKLFYDLFHRGRWIGMAEGVDEDDAKRMAARCLPQLAGQFALVRWYGCNHPDNCKSSGGNALDPAAEAERTRRPEEVQEACVRAIEELDCLYVNGDRHPFGGTPADPYSSDRRGALQCAIAAIRALDLTEPTASQWRPIESMVPKGWVIVGLTNGMLDPKYLDVRAMTCW